MIEESDKQMSRELDREKVKTGGGGHEVLSVVISSEFRREK